MSTSRTPEEIRASLEARRNDLSSSIELLRDDVTELADWREQIRRNQKAVAIAVGVTGFVLAGGIGALTGVFRRRR